MSDVYYFSDRENGPRSRIETEISQSVWAGLTVAVQKGLTENAFALAFPGGCPDDPSIIAYTDTEHFHLAYQAEIPEMPAELDPHRPPSTLTVLDFIEFCYRNIAKAIQEDYHSYWRHYHLEFDREAGQSEFRDIVNRLFSRNRMAFELQANGQIIRLVPPALRQALMGTMFNTGDETLDHLLEDSRVKFLSPDIKVRKEALEKLWDAWERLKTIKSTDKKASVTALLKDAAPTELFFTRLNNEARELTEIGNNFQIRHWETDKPPISDSDHIDYLFHRLFALIYLLLRRQGMLRTSAEPDQEPDFLDELPF